MNTARIRWHHTHATIQRVLTICIILASMPIGAAAENLPKEPILPLAMAQKAAAAAMAKCEEGGYHVSVAVVDQGGNIRTLFRGDGAGPHTVDSSSRKAYTSASLRRSTQHLAELVAKMPTLRALGDMNDKVLILGGGLPIEFNGTVVGGIGVGGAPGTQLDEACAAAGLLSIGATGSGGSSGHQNP